MREVHGVLNPQIWKSISDTHPQERKKPNIKWVKKKNPLLEYPGTTHSPKSHQRAKLLYEINLSEYEVYQKLIAKRKFGLFGDSNQSKFHLALF